MATVRQVLTNLIQGLRDRRQHLVAEIDRMNAQIDTLQAFRDGLTAGEEDKLAQLQSFNVIRTEG